jgi:hypothetical protein
MNLAPDFLMKDEVQSHTGLVEPPSEGEHFGSKFEILNHPNVQYKIRWLSRGVEFSPMVHLEF